MAEPLPTYTPIHRSELNYSPWSVRLVHLPYTTLDEKNSSSCRAYLRHGNQSSAHLDMLHTSTIALFHEISQVHAERDKLSWSKLSKDTYNDILDAVS